MFIGVSFMYWAQTIGEIYISGRLQYWREWQAQGHLCPAGTVVSTFDEVLTLEKNANKQLQYSLYLESSQTMLGCRYRCHNPLE